MITHRIDTKTGRARLEPRREPYWWKYAKDRHVGFRKTGPDSGSWIARHRDEAGKRQYGALGELSETFGFDEAVAKALVWFKGRDAGITAENAETVGEVCRLYVKDRRRAKGEAAANDAHRRFEREVYGGGGKDGKRHEAHTLAALPLRKVRTRILEEWRDGMVEGGLSKDSADRNLIALKAALNFAVRHRYVGADAAIEWRSAKPFNAGKRRDLYLDIDQRRELLKAAEGSLRDLIEAVMHTGARAGELVSARRSQFDARTQSLSVTGKTGSRPITLSAAAVTFFKRMAESKLPTAYLLTRDDGKPWAHSDWDELVRDAAAKAELPAGVCLYTLRHSWITAAISEGLSPLEVARLVGTSLQMIDRYYGHLGSVSVRERLAKFVAV